MSDLVKYEREIMRGISGEPLTGEYALGQWKDQPGYPWQPGNEWKSHNWFWFDMLCRTFVPVERAKAFSWCREELDAQLHRGCFMRGELFSRGYGPLMVFCLMGLRRQAEEHGQHELAMSIQHWINSWFTYAALMAVDAPQKNQYVDNKYVYGSYACGMAGARSFTRYKSYGDPEHLDYWVGSRMLFTALSEYPEKLEDRPSWWDAHLWEWAGGPKLDSNRANALRQIIRGNVPAQAQWILEELPGILAPFEIVRFQKGVLSMLEDNEGLSIGSTDTICACYTAENGQQQWLTPDDGIRKGGGRIECDLSPDIGTGARRVAAIPDRGIVSAQGLFTSLYDDGENNGCQITFFPGREKYTIRVDSRGATMYTGEQPVNTPGKPAGGSPGQSDPPGVPSPASAKGIALARLLAIERLTRESAASDPLLALQNVVDMLRADYPEVKL